MRLGARGPSLAALLALGGIAALLLLGSGGNGGSSGPAAPVARGRSVTAPVVYVVDGDTIKVAMDGGEEYVRYIGVDTPETVDPEAPVGCYGHRASDFNASLVEGRTVRLTFDAEQRDKYGRLLAYVHVGHEFVNAELVRRGYARTLAIEPNTSKEALFARLASEAAGRGRGLWGAC